MNKQLLCAAVVSGLALSANCADAAVVLNSRGSGQVLLYPYYTVNGGNDTYLSITNTTDRGKAVKLRFMEGRNSRTVLEFSVYMSPFDVWTGALVSLNANGPANLLTRDSSCTVPAIVTSTALPQLADGTRYVAFRNFSYAAPNSDGGDAELSRTREGHIEVIDMGTLNSGAAPTQVEDDVTHHSATGTPNSSVPTNCTQVVSNWQSVGGAWGDSGSGNRQLDISLPTGGLYGEAQIINVANGTLHSYSADAIEGFYGGSAAPGGLHYAPASGRPHLADASNGTSTIDSRLLLDSGRYVTSTWSAGGPWPNAVSAALMQSAIYNEFDTEAGIGAQSEWVMTFPTKHYYTDSPGFSQALPPFLDAFGDDGQSCEPFYAPIDWDRESLRGQLFYEEGCLEFAAAPPPQPIPASKLPKLCDSAHVLRFNQSAQTDGGLSSIFASRNVSNVDTGYRTFDFNTCPATDTGRLQRSDRGHLAFSLGDSRVIHQMRSIDGDILFGLPVIGFWSANYVNSAAQPGKLANYSGSIRHRGRPGFFGI